MHIFTDLVGIDWSLKMALIGNTKFIKLYFPDLDFLKFPKMLTLCWPNNGVNSHITC